MEKSPDMDMTSRESLTGWVYITNTPYKYDLRWYEITTPVTPVPPVDKTELWTSAVELGVIKNGKVGSKSLATNIYLYSTFIIACTVLTS
jgi:hypothetical protein